MQMKSTLRVVNSKGLKSYPGVCEGHTLKPLIGFPDTPTDRLRSSLAFYEAGSLEELHWHPIEAFYFVISGHAIVRDIEGGEFEVGPGSFIYAPAGIAGAHEWEVKEGLQITAVRATTDPERKLQFTVDKKTKRSYIDLDELAKLGGINFKSHY